MTEINEIIDTRNSAATSYAPDQHNFYPTICYFQTVFWWKGECVLPQVVVLYFTPRYVPNILGDTVGFGYARLLSTQAHQGSTHNNVDALYIVRSN